MKKIWIAVVGLLALPLLAVAGDWECKLTVKSGVAENVLTFGQKADASNGIDGRYDVPALLRGAVQARFVEGGQGYWRDIKGPGAADWLLSVDVSDAILPVTAVWSGCAIPAGTKVTLEGVGEMAASGSAALGSGKKHYSVKVHAE